MLKLIVQERWQANRYIDSEHGASVSHVRESCSYLSKKKPKYNLQI